MHRTSPIADPRRAFTFIDLFAGIGGTRLGFEAAGGECVFSSEWDRFSCRTYETNFGEMPHGDITKIASEEIPNHDVLVAGFPCQPFSIAGVSKHRALGNPDGFLHRTQGTLFFEVARIIHDKKPKAFLLENVRNLVSHDGGQTFKTILAVLSKDLGYNVQWKIIDGAVAVPQHRERTYIVGFREPVDFHFPEFAPRTRKLRDILEAHPDRKYVLTSHLWGYLQNYAAKHRAKGNGFGFGLVDLQDEWIVTRTLSARYYKDGSEILLPTDQGRPRRLTPRECARLMGFPETFQIPVSDTQAYHQFGNSVVVPVVQAVAREMVSCLLNSPEKSPKAQSLAAQAQQPLPGTFANGAKGILPTTRGGRRATAGSLS